MIRSTRFLAVLLAAAGSLGAPAAAGDWPTFRGDAARSGNPGDAPFPKSPARRWSHRCADCKEPAFDASPAFAGDAVYAGVADQSAFFSGGRVVCLDAATGAVRWERKTTHPVFSSPAVAAGRVFVGEGYHQHADCRLYCLDARTGDEVWTFATRSHIESSPHVEGDQVLFGAGDDGIYCLRASSGEVIWHAEGDHVDVSPLVSSGLVFAGAGYGGQAAICLDAKDGKPRWRTPLDLPVWGAPVRVGARVFFGLGNGNLIASDAAPRGAIVCLAATSGAVLWRADLLDAVLCAVAHRDGRLFAGSRDGHLHALEAATGKPIWKRSLGAPVVSSPIVAPGQVGAIASNGLFAIAAIESGEVVATFELAKGAAAGYRVISSPALAPGLLVVGAPGGILALGDAAGVAAGGAAVPRAGAGGALEVDRAGGRVRIAATAAKQGIYKELAGAIEYVLVARGGKDYESLFVTDVEPEALRAALIDVGATPGRPAAGERGPRGARFRILVERETDGKATRGAVDELIIHSERGAPLDASTWTFTGSIETLDPATDSRTIQCATTKSLVGLHYTDASPLFQNSRPEAVDENIYKAAVDRLPAAGMAVTLVLELVAPAEGTRRVHAFVSGRVQGVGFRAFVQREARARGLAGFVRNLEDGRVEGLIEGPGDAVAALLEKLERGPRAARVERVESRDEKALGDYAGFEVE